MRSRSARVSWAERKGQSEVTPQNNLFIHEATNPVKWWFCGIGLERSASALRRHWEGLLAEDTPGLDASCVYRSALMMYGYAIENYIKAILIKKRILEVRSKGQVVKLARSDGGNLGHQLDKLAMLAVDDLEPGRGAILRHLTEYVVWRGRYVAPLTTLTQDSRLSQNDDTEKQAVLAKVDDELRAWHHERRWHFQAISH